MSNLFQTRHSRLLIQTVILKYIVLLYAWISWIGVSTYCSKWSNTSQILSIRKPERIDRSGKLQHLLLVTNKQKQSSIGITNKNCHDEIVVFYIEFLWSVDFEAQCTKMLIIVTFAPIVFILKILIITIIAFYQ